MKSKRELLLSTARELLSRYGLARVTVDQICQHAETSRVTFYKHFDNKEALVLVLLEEQVKHGAKVFDMLEDPTLCFSEKVERLIEFKIAQTEQFAEGFLHELMVSPSPGIAAFMAEQMQLHRAQMTKFFEQARQSGEIREDISMELLWYLLEQGQKMFSDPALHKLFPNDEQRQKSMMQFFFYGIGQNKS